MKEFNRLFNVFTVVAILIMLFTTAVAASLTVINKGKSNLYSVNGATKGGIICEYCITNTEI